MTAAKLLRADRVQTGVAWLVLVLLVIAYFWVHPRGMTSATLTIWSNQIFVLAVLAVGQAIVVFTRSLDLSIGSVLALSNCVAARLVNGSWGEIILGIIAVLAVGALCGLVNGLVVVYGRVQAIIATLATGAIFTGLALLVLPIPGGEVSFDLSDLLTMTIFGVIPTSLVLLVACVGLFWGTIRTRPLGRSILAVGSSEHSAYMSGLPIQRARVAAFVLAGLFSSIGGLFLGLQTLSGDPNGGLPYTLNAVAAAVIGGVALSGGQGSAAAAVAGAMVLQTISALLFFTEVAPLAQPAVQGCVLALAVSVGGIATLKNRNRLDVF